MTSWKTYKIGDIIDEIAMGPFGSNIKVDNFIDFGVPVLNGANLQGFKLKEESFNYVSSQKADSLGRANAFRGDIVITHRGTLGQIVYIPNDSKFDRYIISQSQFRVRLNSQYVLPEYFVYYFHTRLGQHKLLMNASQVGVPALARPTSTFKEITIALPSLVEQRRIAGILSAIDDKIENNRRINTNLELQAQALYKQWFVDNRSDDWERKPLSEIAEFIGGYSYKGNELVEASSTAMATIKNFERKGGFKVEGFKDIVASSKLKAEQHAELFDILVAHTDLTQNADVIGNAEILLTFGGYTDIIFSMDLVKVLPKSNFPYKYLLAALLKNPYFKAHCLGYVNGTTVLHMSKKALPEYIVACPPNSVAEKMDRAFKVYYHKMAEILQENETLATLRDTLLPKLMNGEIKL